MKKFILAFLVIGLLTSCKPQPVSDEQLEKAIENYIDKNPEKVLAALMKAKNKAENPEISGDVMKKVLADLYNNPDHAVIGDPNSKNIVVEFYDYNCGYCKRAFSTVMKLANNDKAKVVLVELPVLGPTSQLAAKASTIVHKTQPEKFFEFHKALLLTNGHIEAETIADVAKKVGIDMDKFNAEMQANNYDSILENNMKIANQLKINGTPSFIVNGEMVRGALPYEKLKKSLK